MDGHPVRAVFGLNRLQYTYGALPGHKTRYAKLRVTRASPQYQRTITKQI